MREYDCAYDYKLVCSIKMIVNLSVNSIENLSTKMSKHEYVNESNCESERMYECEYCCEY